VGYSQDQREKGEDQWSHIRILGTPALASSGDSFYYIYKQTGALIRDDHRNISENNSDRILALCIAKKMRENFKMSLFGSYNWKIKEYALTPIQNVANSGFDFAAYGGLKGNTWWSQGLAGYGKFKEDVLPGEEFTFTSPDSSTTQRNLQDNDQRRLYMQGEFYWFPLPKVSLNWRGYGKIESRDYNYIFRLPAGDTISSGLDNDNTAVNHWVQLGYFPAAVCSLFWETKYSEYRTQNLKAKRSGDNRLQQIYSFVPSAFCEIGNFTDFRQAFELTANYTKHPFVPGDNSLIRQIKTNSQVNLYIGERNTVILFYEYSNFDQGEIDSSNYYSIQKKGELHHWAVDYKREVWENFYWQPGIGRIYNARNSFDFSSRTYVRDSILTGSSWIYSIKASWEKQQFSFLKMNISYFNESTGYNYWESNLSIQMGF
jgi:hypothetical protein